MATSLASRWRRWPFLLQLLATTSAALLVAGALMLVLYAGQEALDAREDLKRELAGELETIPASLRETVVLGDFATLQQTLDHHVRRPKVERMRYRDAEGAEVGSVDRPAPREAPLWFARWFGLSALTGSVPLEVGGREYGVLEITLTAQLEANRTWRRLLDHLAILWVAMGLAFLGIGFVLRSGLRPIRALHAGATALAAGDLEARLEPQGSPEFRGTIAAFNRMADAVREARDSLSREKEHLRVTLSSIGDAVIATDRQGRVQFMNPVAERLTGWGAAEAIGRPLGDVFHVVHEETRQTIESPVEKVLREGIVVGLDNRAVLIDRSGRSGRSGQSGAEHPIADSASPIRDGDSGEIRGAVLVFRDQTDERKLLREVREGRRLLQEFIDHSPAMIHLRDRAGRFLLANRNYERLLGAAPGGLLGRTLEEVQPPKAGRGPKPTAATPGDLDAPRSFEEELVGPDGPRTFLSVQFPLPDEGGRAQGLGTISTDITERRAAERRLQLLASVFENALEGIIITDLEARILEVNPAFCKITGYERSEAVGKRPSILNSGHHPPEFFSALWRSILGAGSWHGEIWNRRKNGEVYPELLTITAVGATRERPPQYIAIFSDISMLKAQQSQLEQLANFDALTRLPNRVLLSDRLQVAMAQALRSGERLAICYLDLDGFKPINDTYGHEAGDRLLIETGARLRAAVRAGDTAARLGGDEFVLLLQGLSDRAEFERTLSRILNAVGQPYRIDDHLVSVTSSAGVSFYPQDGVDADTLLRQADQAMYQAKQEGRNRFHIFDPAHDRRVRTRRQTLLRIEEAIAGGELCLYYQPQVNLRRGTVVGVEALARWRHPTRGLLLPAEFLPALEDSEHAVMLGEYVIDEALQQSERWRAAGLDLSVSVNVSGRQMQRSDFVARLKALLARHPAVPGNRFEIEVLETAALGDIQGVSAIMEECRALGVSFALDDFGTGYSSLMYFKRLPASFLKIDPSFVRNMLHDREDLAIVDGIIGLTDAFQRGVIAEGVESVDHGVMLLHLGCDLAQGFGIAHPMPAEELPGWVSRYRAHPAWEEAARVSIRGDLSLLDAEVDHRRWVEDLVGCLRARSAMGARLPSSDPMNCRFGQWYQTRGKAAYGQVPDFSAIEPLHERIHGLAQELSALCKAGEWARAQEREPELIALRDEIVRYLHRMLAAGASPRP
jgi:diguanylate cyclase (GGDEF)-like protein/PAS domain S-box-containing protein